MASSTSASPSPISPPVSLASSTATIFVSAPPQLQSTTNAYSTGTYFYDVCENNRDSRSLAISNPLSSDTSSDASSSDANMIVDAVVVSTGYDNTEKTARMLIEPLQEKISAASPANARDDGTTNQYVHRVPGNHSPIGK